MYYLIQRNLKLYFRDKTAVFFSLLSVLITLLIYFLFLGNLILKQWSNMPSAETLLYSWLLGGIISMTSFTTSLGALGIIPQDRQQNIYNDFLSTPVKRIKIIASYVISSMIISLLMSLFVTALGLMFLASHGYSLNNFYFFIKLVAYVVLASFSSTSLALLVSSPLKTMNLFAAVSTVVGTALGFLTGIYTYWSTATIFANYNEICTTFTQCTFIKKSSYRRTY